MDQLLAVILYVILVAVIWLFFKIGNFRMNGRNIISFRWRLLISIFLPLIFVILLFFGLLILAVIVIIIVISFILYLFSRILKK